MFNLPYDQFIDELTLLVLVRVFSKAQALYLIDVWHSYT
jgi:hypothetical protein